MLDNRWKFVRRSPLDHGSFLWTHHRDDIPTCSLFHGTNSTLDDAKTVYRGPGILCLPVSLLSCLYRVCTAWLMVRIGSGVGVPTTIWRRQRKIPCVRIRSSMDPGVCVSIMSGPAGGTRRPIRTLYLACGQVGGCDTDK